MVKIMMAPNQQGSVRERLLAAANELFYAEGIHTVGIDRILDHAGVAKASLYTTFGSKDGLVREYLVQRSEARKQRMTGWIANARTPRDKILAIFDGVIEQLKQPAFRGCAFVNATAEGPREGELRAVVQDLRDWVRDLFARLAEGAGARDPRHVADQLMLLYDGTLTTAALDRDPSGAQTARALAETLVDAATTRWPATIR
jgi:AcrR family transcriptional regulator